MSSVLSSTAQLGVVSRLTFSRHVDIPLQPIRASRIESGTIRVVGSAMSNFLSSTTQLQLVGVVSRLTFLVTYLVAFIRAPPNRVRDHSIKVVDSSASNLPSSTPQISVVPCLTLSRVSSPADACQRNFPSREAADRIVKYHDNCIHWHLAPHSAEIGE